jgi:hypothetical protein
MNVGQHRTSLSYLSTSLSLSLALSRSPPFLSLSFPIAQEDSKEAAKTPTNTQKGPQDKARKAEATKVRLEVRTFPYPLIAHVLFVFLGH